MGAPQNYEKLDHVCSETYGDLGIPQFKHLPNVYNTGWWFYPS